jgi:hypothetical protein
VIKYKDRKTCSLIAITVIGRRLFEPGSQLHRLVQAILRDSPTGTLSDIDMTAAACRLLRDAVPPDPWEKPASWPAWRQLLPTC